MPFPKPVPGLVIRYSYLWREEYQRGQEEGIKDRPCAIILVTTDEADDQKTVGSLVIRAVPSLPEKCAITIS